MRVETRSIAAFLSMPPRVRAVLFHGDVEALVRARADQVTVSVAGAKDDPFRVSWLFRDDHARLAGEAALYRNSTPTGLVCQWPCGSPRWWP